MKFYKKMQVALPDECFDCRHLKRVEIRSAYGSWETNCGKCSKDIVTTEIPDKNRPVYCKDCYRKEIYG